MKKVCVPVVNVPGAKLSARNPPAEIGMLGKLTQGRGVYKVGI